MALSKKDSSLLLIAVCFGLLAALLVSRYLKTAASQGKTFVVAAQPVEAGKEIQAEQVKLSEPMTNAQADELFLQVADVIGKEAAVDIKRGALIHREEVKLPIAEEETAKKQALPIPPGMRAFDLSAKNVFRVPELLMMGTYIDIVGHLGDENGGGHMRTVLHSAQVLSINQTKEGLIDSFSIAVTSEEAETVAGAISRDKVQIILRSEPGDKPRFSHSGGVMEVIRGVKQGQTVSFGGQGTFWKGKDR